MPVYNVQARVTSGPKKGKAVNALVRAPNGQAAKRKFQQQVGGADKRSAPKASQVDDGSERGHKII